jgi:Helix-turn-helix domain
MNFPQSTGERRWTTDRIPCRGCRRIISGETSGQLCPICRGKSPGERLRIARELAGLTIFQLAEMLGVPVYLLAEIEAGVLPSTALVAPLCHALGVLPKEIWRDGSPFSIL